MRDARCGMTAARPPIFYTGVVVNGCRPLSAACRCHTRLKPPWLHDCSQHAQHAGISNHPGCSACPVCASLRAYLRCDRDLSLMTAWISLNRPQVLLVILHDADEARTKTSNGSTIAEYPVQNDAVCPHLAFRYICHFVRPGLVYSPSPKTPVTHLQTHNSQHCTSPF